MINCIVAVENGQGIGFNGQMPWPRLKGDMAWFRAITTNNVIIMGSTTWKSIGCKALPNRINIVLSKTKDYSGDNAADHTFSDHETALAFCENEYLEKEIFIIGGSAIYQLYMPLIDRFFITEINSSFSCDTFFNLNYVQANFTNVKEHVKFTDPIPYIIKEYSI